MNTFFDKIKKDIDLIKNLSVFKYRKYSKTEK